MKHKILTFALALLTAASAWAQTFTIGELTYNVTDLTNKEVEVSDCAETATNITIPTEVLYNNVYYDVTSIRGSAFSNCSSLTNISIPNSITNIGANSFQRCSSLTEISIPNSVTSIGEYAFNKCTSLVQVTIGNSVTSIGDNAFNDCESLTAVYYTGDVEGWCEITFQTPGLNGSTNPLYYAHNLYINNTLLTELIIPEGVSEIKKYAFRNCTSITKVTIPNSVTNIGFNAFAFCSSITQLSIGDGVQTIDNSAFSTCSSLEQVTIGNQITEIGQNAFQDCSKIVAVNYTGDIAKWCSINFYNYSSNPLYYARNLYINNTLLTKLTIPDDITEIKNFAFYNCDALTQVTIPNSVTNIGVSAFNDCDGLTEITIPNNVTTIGGNAFYNCSALTKITIGSNAESIGQYAFRDCDALTSIHSYATIAPTLHRDDPFTFTSFDLVFIPANSTESYIEKWGNGYTYIEEGSDTELSVHVETPGGLAAAVIVAGSTPAKVTRLKVTGTLNNDDFGILKTYMTKLYSLDLSGITNTTLPNKAFQDKATLIDIKLPDNLTAIPDYAFDACKFTSIDIPNSVVSIGNSAFYECTSLKEVSLSENLTSIGSKAFYGCSALGSITIPGSVVSIKDQSFSGCDVLKQVNIEDIGNWCAITFSSASANPLYYVNNFYVDNQLATDLVIPDNVTAVSKYAFTNATNLESVTFGSHVENIAYDAFQNCTNINKLTCLSTEPPVVSGTAFTTINPKICQLEVPATAVMDYITAPVWSTFENMSFITVGEATHLLNLHIGQDGRIIYEGNSYSNGHILEVPTSTPVTLQISAPAGYILESVNYNGTDYTAQVSEEGLLTLPALTDDATLQVSFSQQNYIIAYYVAGSNAYYFTTTTYGETFRCHAAATEGHTIQSVTLNGIDITEQLGEDGLLEITNITANCTLIINTDGGQATETASVQQKAPFRAWQSNGEIFVEHTQDMTAISIFDTNGRLLHQTETNGYGVLHMPAFTQVHIIKAEFTDGTYKSQKIM